MSKRVNALKIAILLLVLSAGCGLFQAVHETDRRSDIPSVQREFRAAWVATVANVDWPSAPGLSTDVQISELQAILDTASALNLNTLIVQMRPQCDALYPSELEPWSYYLTGVQGQAPAPYYDPLDFWVEEAHKRGIELHVWFNPYRAHHPQGGDISDESIVKVRPELVKQLDNGYYWLNPSHPGTQAHSFAVVMDVLRRYDIDGIHFDDYFYPYGDGNFPDDDTWAAYQADGGDLSRGDWRRECVNRFIEKLYRAIKDEKPWVKFGLSPFGIWRPGYPESIRGFDQYSILYADARLWLNEGWVDYWSPQLYWPISQIPQSFPVLLGWWTRENHVQRNLWPGLYTSRIADSAGAVENLNQIMTVRGFLPDMPGHIHFSMRALMEDRGGIKTALKKGPYAWQALVPASPWLDDKCPDNPSLVVRAENDSVRISWAHAEPEDIFRWVLYMQYNDHWQYKILSRNTTEQYIPAFISYSRGGRREAAEPAEIRIDLSRIAISVVDRAGNESAKVSFIFAENDAEI